jgi:hypothetical protein
MKQLFIGLDVHKKTWAVTIQEDHLVLKRFTIEADADLLTGYVSRHFPGYQVQCCYECCCCGYHIYHSLTAAGRSNQKGNRLNYFSADRNTFVLHQQLAAIKHL